MERLKTNGKSKQHGWLKMMPALLGLRVIILLFLGAAPYLLLAQHFDKNEVTIQLDSMAIKDQALRERLVYMDQHWHDSMQTAYDSLWARQNAQDQCNMLAIEALNKRYGWQQLMELYDQAKSTIFLVIQHSDSLHQVKFLPLIYQSVKMRALPPNDYALLKDRVTLLQSKRQYYGTQCYFDQQQNKFVPFAIIGGKVAADKRMAALGMDSLAVYLEFVNRPD
ncbi:hypothetical protein GCM10027566_02850 [Arachidicoccus ginsenosidivorans]|jgi:hypothetical protein|uniref:Uncharacterized protein n=1 Tax=Arachidicoccus ginsenosidivorans TaxID=496057 RepID=A0A5B8VLP2_9BACT|nr:DUF6624 domain-containing protein [Arachidicoccus ginsenosidivorans]QEC72447.1 hypothetical protein FSB73_12945 [Arachidicoccus ginsenosidivorans]